MKYNDDITLQYGKFSEISTGESPLPFKPTPSSKNYTNGNFTRAFAKKINDDILIEIKSEQANKINQNLYKVVYINWVIIGPRENRSINGVIDPGVSVLYIFEIERVQKEADIDLKKVLHNLLEYWQGH
jgi:hypothetical protein